MKNQRAKKATDRLKLAERLLAAKAAEAEQQAEGAGKLAQLARFKLKQAKKAFKLAKKAAKSARRRAKEARKALKAAQKKAPQAKRKARKSGRGSKGGKAARSRKRGPSAGGDGKPDRRTSIQPASTPGGPLKPETSKPVEETGQTQPAPAGTPEPAG